MVSARAWWSIIEDKIRSDLISAAQRYEKMREFRYETFEKHINIGKLNDAHEQVMEDWAKNEGLEITFDAEYITFSWDGKKYDKFTV